MMNLSDSVHMNAETASIQIDTTTTPGRAPLRRRRRQGNDLICCAFWISLCVWPLALMPVLLLITEPIVLFLVGKAFVSKWARPSWYVSLLGVLLGIIAIARILVVAGLLVVPFLA